MIERLESRIAPATLINIDTIHKSAVWKDFDGDTVTLKWTTGQPGFVQNTFTFASDPNAVSVDEIDLNVAADANDAITVTVKAGPHGDGHVALGYVNAQGVALKSFVAPAASVLEMDAGDTTHAIGTLTVGGYGAEGSSAFPNANGDGEGVLDGAVGSVLITGDFVYGKLTLGHDGTTAVGTVKIGGSLEGRVISARVAGDLDLKGPTKSVTIGRSIFGGAITDSGSVKAENTLGSVHIGGDIIGGTALRTGFLSIAYSTPLAAITVGGSVLGGSVIGSGIITVQDIASVTVAGDLRGGADAGTGSLLIGAAKAITVKGSVMGGDVTNPSQFSPTGSIQALGSVGAITIGRNLVAGTTEGNSGQLGQNGSIFVQGNLASLKIGGEVLGHDGFRALITVQGSTPAKPGSFDALGKATFGGSVEYAVIDTGAAEGIKSDGTLGLAVNPDAGIGSITIAGNFLHSSILAGTNDLSAVGAGPTTGNGTFNLDSQSTGDPTRHAVLGPVTIKGTLENDYYANGDSGFEAETIAKIIVSGHQVYAHGGGLAYLDSFHNILADEIPLT